MMRFWTLNFQGKYHHFKMLIWRLNLNYYHLTEKSNNFLISRHLGRNFDENYISSLLSPPRALKRSPSSLQERSLINLIHRLIMSQPPPNLQFIPPPPMATLQVQSPLSTLSNPRGRDGQKRQGSKEEPPVQSLELKEIRRNANSAGRNRDFQTNGW